MNEVLQNLLPLFLPCPQNTAFLPLKYKLRPIDEPFPFIQTCKMCSIFPWHADLFVGG